MICLTYNQLLVAAFVLVVAFVAWKAEVILYWVLDRVSTPLDVDVPAFMAFLRTHGMEATPAMVQHELSPDTRRAFREAEERARHRRVIRTRLITIGVSIAIWAALWTLLR